MNERTRANQLTCCAILLVFVALIGGCGENLRTSTTAVDLPEANNRTPLKRAHVTAIITRDAATRRDVISVNGDTVALPQLLTTFAADFQPSDPDLIVEAASNVKYGTVLTVLFTAYNAGFTQFGLANSVRGIATNEDQLMGFQKYLPAKHNAAHSAAPDGAIEIMVDKTDRVAIERKMLSKKQLYPSIAEVIDHRRLGRHSMHISLIADSDATWGAIIRILDAARQAGDDDIGFVYS
jgi:biopolymer transport protein ExbD